MNDTFASIAFSDRDAAGRALSAIVDGERPRLAERLASELAHVADPNRVLVRLEAFLTNAISPNVQRDLMEAAPAYLECLTTICDQSGFLSDILRRNPTYMNWLFEEAELDRARPAEELARDARSQLGHADTFQGACESLRRFYRREILRIGVRDLVRHAALDSVMEDLSNLADAVLEIVLEKASDHLKHRFGAPQEGGDDARFAILAMGKLGGRELNFSSDIDLLFVYSSEGQTAGGPSGSISHAEYFNKLGELIIKGIAEQTQEGRILRIDMRLRPHGRMGPLATSLDTCLAYYERHGQAWERQALIKTRLAAGDAGLGTVFIERTRPFVFPRYFDDETLEDILDTRRQMEAQIQSRQHTGREVKRGRGGIRDIEFTVQMLQMLNGGRIEDLRTPNTLEAIALLGEHDLLSPFEANALASNYVFLRQVEHRLQIDQSQQLHLLPEAGPVLDDFARRMGYAHGESFMAEYRERSRGTRAVLDRFIESEASGNLWISDLLNPRSDGEASVPRLQELGFADPEKARGEFLLLSCGPADRPHSMHVRQQFAKVAPSLIEALAHRANPDATLLRLGQIIGNIKAPSVIYDLLRWNPNLCEYLAILIENSNYLAQLLVQDPGLFETFGVRGALDRPAGREALQEDLANLQQAYEPDAALSRFQRGQILRIGMRELIAGADVLDIGRELSHVAEVCLDLAVWLAREKVANRHGGATAQFAVLGLGKLGGSEMGYGSDLDLVFVYDESGHTESGMATSEYFFEVAAQVMRVLRESPRFGRVYDIDPRLRPDGNKGVLAVSRSRFAEYYANEAEAWERLALVKIRGVSGDRNFGRDIEKMGRDLAFNLELSTTNLERIEEIRRRLAAKADALDLKKAEGGLAELEFAVRLNQLAHVAQSQGLRRGDVLGALDILVGLGAVESADAAFLSDTYLLFRRIENRIRMMEGRPGSVLPADDAQRKHLAKRLGIDDDLAELAASRKAWVHEFYKATMERLLTAT